MYFIAVYVPASHKEALIDAMGEAGAGRVGDYEACAWATKGQGQFRPLAGAHPYLGQLGNLEQVEEYKIEVVCEESAIKAVLEAMVAAHPYEEPAHHVLPVMTRLDF